MAKTADYDLGSHTFPRGWLMVALAADVSSNPAALRMIGNDFVIYRGESGRVVLMDAYCPHMRAHLAADQSSSAAAKRIEGDSIRCPYHSWLFAPDGQCSQIPYHEGAIPKAAKIRSYPIREAFGAVFMWHDPEGGAPDYDLPDIPEWDDQSWINGAYRDLGTLDVHPQEIVDNLVDAHHFGPIHGQRLVYFESIFDDHLGWQLSGGGHETMTSDDGFLDVDAFYTGPAILVARYSGEADAVQLICHTPKEDGVTQIWHTILTKAQNDPVTQSDIDLHHGYYEAGLGAFSQDFAIWQSKGPATSILRVGSDGPFNRSRLWYRQFYNPRADTKRWQERANGRHPTQGLPGAPANR